MATLTRTDAGVPLVYAVDFGGADAVTNGTPYKTAFGVPKVKFAASEDQSNRHKSNDTDLVIASTIATNTNPHRSATGIRKVCIVNRWGYRPGQSSFSAGESIRKTAEGIDKVCLSDLWGNPVEPFDVTGYWPLASGGAVDLTDYGPNGFTLTNHGTITRAAGPSAILADAAAMASASSQYASHADDAKFHPVSPGFTAGAWAYLTNQTADQMVMGQWDVNSQRSWRIAFASATPRWSLNMSTNGTTVTTLTGNTFGAPSSATWYFLALRWDGATLKITVNAASSDSVAFTPFQDSSGLFTIGAAVNATTPNTFMNGRLAHAYIGPRSESDAMLAWRYNGGNGRDLRVAA